MIREPEYIAPPDPDTLPDPPADWHNTHANLVTLVDYMAGEGATGFEVAHAVEKPWNHTDEYKLAVWTLEDNQP